jgi:SAM-dependent methyltransferase
VGRDVYGRPPPRPAPWDGRISRRALLRLPVTDAARLDVDYEGATRRALALWDRDGHNRLLRAIEPIAEVVAGAAGARPGSRVLDVGAGDGNVALACVQRGAEVAACDIAPAMVARGRKRSEAAGAGIVWRIGDVQSLPYADASFDVVTSAFGASLAPNPAAAVRELVRVARPGGAIVLAAWAPRGLPGGLYPAFEALNPLPDGVPSPDSWGLRDSAARRLAGLEELALRTRTAKLRFPSGDACFDALAPTVVLDGEERTRLRPHFDALLASVNNRPPEVELDARYLLASGRRSTS